MRWWPLLPLVLACSHGPAPAPETRDFSSTNPARAVASDLAKAVPVTGAIARPLNKPVVVLGFLCVDRSKAKCPSCPEGATCEACRDPAWIFCDTPGAVDRANALWVVEPPPGFALSVGQRYLLKGQKTDTREMSLEAIFFAD
jgi:hypothetical protein